MICVYEYTKGSTLFPATKATCASLFPIIDKNDGNCKPAILILVEEAVSAGIEEIYVIVSKHDKQSFEALFYETVPSDQFEKLSPTLKAYAHKILELGKHLLFFLVFIFQFICTPFLLFCDVILFCVLCFVFFVRENVL